MHYDGSVLVGYLLLEADGRYGATSSFCEPELWCSESGDGQAARFHLLPQGRL